MVNYMRKQRDMRLMNNEKILYYLGILENGALNYYQAIETIRIASQSIQDYIEQLEEQVKKQKEVIDKVYELIKQHIRKDGFLELNEWQTRDLLDILNEV